MGGPGHPQMVGPRLTLNTARRSTDPRLAPDNFDAMTAQANMITISFENSLPSMASSFEPSPPYTQAMNGASERMIQTLNTRARSMMIDANIPISIWAEMINTASYLQQRSATIALQNRTLYELLHRAIASTSRSSSDPGRDFSRSRDYTPPMNHLR